MPFVYSCDLNCWCISSLSSSCASSHSTERQRRSSLCVFSLFGCLFYLFHFFQRLESQFLEEVGAALCLLFAGDILLVQVSVCEKLLEVLLDIDLALSIHQIGLIDCLLQVKIDDVSCWEDVSDVDVLDEWLHGLSSLLDLGLVHCACDLAWISRESSNEAVRELLVTTAIVECLDDDCLLSGVTSGEDNNNLSSLDDSHCVYSLVLRRGRYADVDVDVVSGSRDSVGDDGTGRELVLMLGTGGR
mmetsp:Transcript_5878/g.15937  ORF Transcript_5878/g.15937 Transcript_5878/m.15937 type:complete len:245 (-) Transcript_5878:26-760(-)